MRVGPIASAGDEASLAPNFLESLECCAGTNLTEVYAVIVSFGVYFNGTTLDEIAAMVGVQASPYQILSNLVRYGIKCTHTERVCS